MSGTRPKLSNEGRNGHPELGPMFLSSQDICLKVAIAYDYQAAYLL